MMFLMPTSVLVLSCSSAPSDPNEPADTRSALSAASQSAFELRHPRRSSGEIANRAQILAGIVSGQPLDSDALSPIATAVASPSFPGRVHLGLRGHDGLTAGYDSSRDEIWAWNESAMNDYTSPKDIGLGAAKGMFKSTLARVLSESLVAPTGLNLDPDAAEVSLIKQVIGRSDGSFRSEMVKEYSFFAQRRINGIPLMDAGVRVNVHRTGVVTLINVSGPTVEADVVQGVEVPRRAGRKVTRTVPDTDLASRVQREYPGATIKPLGLVYKPADGVDAVVAPTQTYTVSSNTTLPNGKTMHGRLQYLHYSLEDAAASPVVWPTPNPGATGDPRPQP